METVRKRKASAASENVEAVGDAVIPESPDIQEEYWATMVMEEVKVEKPTLPAEKLDLLADAPLLYGNNPTAQEIEDFKKAETIWRSKLRSL